MVRGLKGDASFFYQRVKVALAYLHRLFDHRPATSTELGTWKIKYYFHDRYNRRNVFMT